jgi:glycosyltransferase involved in cell wall biosynthesis
MSTPSAPRDPAPSPAGTVLLVIPGGLEHGGGIGRQMGYFLGAPRRPDLAYRVVDSRGPWFLGASRLHTLLAFGYLLRAGLRLISARLGAAPAVAHVNVTGRGSTLRKLALTAVARAVGLPYLLHVHDYDYAAEYRRSGARKQALIRGMFRGAARTLVLGSEVQRELVALLQLPPGQVVVLPNAVPEPKRKPEPARHAGGATAGAPCHLVFLGYLSARKGVPELLQALASPALIGRPWRATLAGGGPVDEYRRQADALGLGGRIAFPGWLDQNAAAALCADADALVLPSHAEGLAMSVLEGLAHGLAVIATPVGAHAEVIEPELSGLLVPPGDAAALARALARVIDDGALRARLQAGARRRFLEKFNVRSYAERLGNLHAGLLPGRPRLATVGREQTS